MPRGMESLEVLAPSASPGRLAAAGWGSRAGIHFTLAASRTIARPAATPSAVPCADGRLRPRSGVGAMPGRPPKWPRPQPSWPLGLAVRL
eukprot:14588045-Alexandrium_andersonii.AAC.1